MDPNTMLLCCLLHLGCISSPQTYTNCQIQLLEQAHHSQVVSIESDPPTLTMVENQYGTAAGLVQIDVIPGCE